MDKKETLSSLGSVLRDGSLYHRAPPHLRARVLAELPHELPRESPRRTVFAWGGFTADGVRAWLNGGLTGIAVCALALSAVTLIQRPTPTGSIDQEIVSSHVRALLSQHPIDVVSTDQHTVKPWFNGRLDYTPPVVDLAAQGFPLVGGRIDYVGHRTVAVLIYRYQKHPIDLYVFPDAGGTPSPAARASDGYAMAHWQRNGMTYWAITDAQSAHLHAFEQAVQAEEDHEENPLRE
ncbi:anti-sigma factor family protein [Collimonas silvisoli]|uniref:anti-sigma factor family protein n=1 Tax=Collimonas silvisoli TaxID=2825884 RepID=UPI001B8B1560|nr:anti-sigma factor [Collimonas silvisoli]